MSHDDTTNTTDGEDDGDLQRWIDGLLRSSEAAEREATPRALHVAVTAAMGRLRRRRRQALVAAAAAAAIAGVIVTWPSGPQAPATVANPSPGSSLQGRGINEQVARFETNGETIAVPLASGDAQVTVIQLYPTTTTERRWRRETAFYGSNSEQDGG